MTHRLYFWFKGAPKDRPGGPWWHQDFPVEGDLGTFLNDTDEFLYQWAIVEGKDLPVHDSLNIYPPEAALIHMHPDGPCDVCPDH